MSDGLAAPRLLVGLDLIEIELAGQLQCLGQGLDAQLVAVGADEANLTGTDALVVPVFWLLRRCYGCSLLCNGCVPSCVGDAKSPNRANTHRTRRHATHSSMTRNAPSGGRVGFVDQRQPTSPQLSAR
mgnify:CR=1 FL=1